MRTFAFVLLVALCATAVKADDEEIKWADTDTTTKMWQAISSGDLEALKKIVEEDEGNAKVRAADGRGPLFWAYEYKNTEAIALLEEKGADKNSKDADGKTAMDIDKAGEMTEFMKKKKAEEAAAAAKLAEQQAAAAAAAAAADDGAEDDYDDEDEDDDEDDEDEDGGDKKEL